MLLARRASPCSLSRLCRRQPRPCSRRLPARCCFHFIFQNNCSDLKCRFVRIDTYQSEGKYVRNWVVKQVALSVHFRSTFQIPEIIFFFSCASFFHFSFCLAPCVLHNRAALGPKYLVPVCIYMHTECCCRCCCSVYSYTAVAAAGAAAACCCCSSPCAEWQNSLLVH